MKKALSIFLASILVCSMAVSTTAAVPEPIVPLWDNISRITNTVTFNGTKGTAKGLIIGTTGTDEISATLTVYVQNGSNWVFVGSDSDTVTSKTLALTVDFTGTSGGYYKSVLEVTVTIDGVAETETITEYRTC